MDVRVRPLRRLSTKELMLSNSGAGENTCESRTARRLRQSILKAQPWIFIGRTDIEAPVLCWKKKKKIQKIATWCKDLMEKAMATHSSTLAWEIPWTEEPGRLQSMRSQRVGYDWATSLSLFTYMHWRRKWQPTPIFLPGESQGWEPGGLPSMGSHRVRHDWCDLAAAAKSWFTGKGPYAGKDWGQEEKVVTDDKMVGWHHWFNGHEFEQTLGDSKWQGNLVCCNSWCCKESDMTSWLYNKNKDNGMHKSHV